MWILGFIFVNQRCRSKHYSIVIFFQNSLLFNLGGFAPFQIFVNFDSNEEITTDTTEDKNENYIKSSPSGFVGFSLDYTQVSCT